MYYGLSFLLPLVEFPDQSRQNRIRGGKFEKKMRRASEIGRKNKE
jgi:hypothetical protein